MRRALVILDPPRPGRAHMAIDASMTGYAAEAGVLAVRVYTWSPPAVSLGRSQPASDVRLAVAAALGFDVVRRPSGGRAIVHMPRDITYSIAAPAGDPIHEAPIEEAAAAAAGIVAGALRRLGVPARPRGPTPYRPGGPICLLAAGSGDILVGDKKVSGAAVLRGGRATLVHGVVLVDHSPSTWLSLVRAGPGETRLFQESVAGLERLGRPVRPGELAAALPEELEERGYATRTGGLPWSVSERVYASE